MIDASTGLMALLGAPVSHSLSPRMQNRALRAAGLNCVYLAFHVEGALGEAVRGLGALGALGANVTIPYKKEAFSLCEPVGYGVRLGAVNTLVFRARRVLGYNTDVDGILFALRGASVGSALLLGAGGAALGAAMALGLMGCGRLTVACRNLAGGEELASMARGWGLFRRVQVVPFDRLRALDRVDALVNATSLGLPGNPWDAGVLEAALGVLDPRGVGLDLVYGEGPTEFVRAGGGMGLWMVDGREVLLGQGAESFRLITRMEAPLEEMRMALYGGGGDDQVPYRR